MTCIWISCNDMMCHLLLCLLAGPYVSSRGSRPQANLLVVCFRHPLNSLTGSDPPRPRQAANEFSGLVDVLLAG